ncbi:MAG: carbon-nitrogen hydrolase family protein [Gemmatimonadetes bacterium]|nr:carbon-nitrogen hydrolase family protein [Gemmatimonadota bacterium]MCY3612363.1 carbon-nitrogen hydrolase family protein [Gemmatimonadota bacterium]MCY3678881.1 carbon-nitrogen hydrolase family protein [Gemmatimonadota bacterium]MYA40403.1 carbon-nitrogen hydrolase family protein [Gemmatimonadota bacterium]MYE95215.1 carbon-nitrogen hydrolase family protein [Gemmatimonadota bacterium]
MPRRDRVRVAAVQPRGYPFDTAAAVEDVCAATAAAAARGAELVLFPEAFVGGYPWGLAFGTSVGGRKPAGRRTFARYHDGAVAIPGPETEKMGRAAKEAGVHLAVGVIEKGAVHSPDTLFCTLLYVAPDGTVAGLHRKLKPTAAERLIWGEGDGSTLPVLDTPFARVGGLICWENYMPLARMAMYGKGVEVYLAPTADSRDRWQATLRHIALEGRCFVIGCNQFVTRDHYPPDLEILAELEDWPHTLSRGGSAIYSPLGELLAGPLVGEAGVLHADLDLDDIPRSKFDFDVVGHYARPDVFDFRVREEPLTAVGISHRNR